MDTPTAWGSGIPGLVMPAEWEPHEATWLAWPHHAPDWPGKLAAVGWVFGEIVRKLVPSEKVRIVAHSPAIHRRALKVLEVCGVDMGRVEFYRIPTDRGWLRDAGPWFLRRRTPKKSRMVVADFHFNAWARYPNWRKDRRLARRVARLLGMPLVDVRWRGRPVVLEGGGIDVNGCGTVLTTEQWCLDPAVQVRNPGLGRRDYEAIFHRYLGAPHVVWLGRGIAGDDTHGHVDDVCRFVNPHTLVVCHCDDPADANYEPLCENLERLKDLRLEDGSRPEIVPLPMPAPLYWRHERLPASYANFYIANTVILVPTFNDAADRKALGILSELFPDRTVVGIHAVDLVLGLGTLHCLTHEQPAQ